MTNFEFHAPTRIISSDNCVETVSWIAKSDKPRHLGVLVDRSVVSLPRIQQLFLNFEKVSLKNSIVEIDAREPDTEFVDEHTARFKSDTCDFLVGIGGGSTLDLAKAVSVLAFNPGSAQEYQGRDLVPNPGCPSIMIPTTAGTGSEVTPGAVVLNPQTKRKGAIWSPYIIPRYAILDPELTRSMPASVAATTGIDALAHAVESFTTRCASALTQMYSREAFRLISGSLPNILRNDDNLDLRRNQLIGATLAGVAICNSDTGACHALAYPLGIYFGVPHGMAVAPLLPHVLAVNIRKGARQYIELSGMLSRDGDRLSDEEKCWQLHEFVAGLAPAGVLPTSLRDYGVRESDVPELAERGLDLKSALSNNPVEFTRDDAQYVLEQLV